MDEACPHSGEHSALLYQCGAGGMAKVVKALLQASEPEFKLVRHGRAWEVMTGKGARGKGTHTIIIINLKK